jgi:hypothetical protein
MVDDQDVPAPFNYISQVLKFESFLAFSSTLLCKWHDSLSLTLKSFSDTAAENCSGAELLCEPSGSRTDVPAGAENSSGAGALFLNRRTCRGAPNH